MVGWSYMLVENENWPSVRANIIERFIRLIEKTGCSDEAVFSCCLLDENITIVYFTPGVGGIVNEVKLKACEMPKNDSFLSVVIGTSLIFHHFDSVIR